MFTSGQCEYSRKHYSRVCATHKIVKFERIEKAYTQTDGVAQHYNKSLTHFLISAVNFNTKKKVQYHNTISYHETISSKISYVFTIEFYTHTHLTISESIKPSKVLVTCTRLCKCIYVGNVFQHITTTQAKTFCL